MSGSVAILEASEYAHSDWMQALLLALRDGVKRRRIHPDAVDPLMVRASRSDCGVVRVMLEAVMREII